MTNFNTKYNKKLYEQLNSQAKILDDLNYLNNIANSNIVTLSSISNSYSNGFTSSIQDSLDILNKSLKPTDNTLKSLAYITDSYSNGLSLSIQDSLDILNKSIQNTSDAFKVLNSLDNDYNTSIKNSLETISNSMALLNNNLSYQLNESINNMIKSINDVFSRENYLSYNLDNFIPIIENSVSLTNEILNTQYESETIKSDISSLSHDDIDVHKWIATICAIIGLLFNILAYYKENPTQEKILEELENKNYNDTKFIEIFEDINKNIESLIDQNTNNKSID